MKSAFDQFREFLSEMFQFDSNDLDFGIFKILKLKRNYIEKFIEGDGADDLRATVTRELARVENTDVEAAFLWLEPYCEDLGKRTREAWQALKADPLNDTLKLRLEAAIDALDENADKAEAAKERVALWVAGQNVSSATIEERLYNYLLNFFELYYQNGDFGYNSRAANAFKVPYEADYDGSDTFFHWKHRDSYYIKTGASFPSVKCEVAGKALEFRLESGSDGEAESTAQNNNKDKEIKLYRLSRIEESDGVWQVVFHLAKEGTPKTELYPKIWAAVFDPEADLTSFLYRKETGETSKPIFNDLAADHDKTDGGQVKGVSQLRVKEESYYKELSKRPEFAGLGKNESERMEALKTNPTAAALYQLDKALNQFFVGNDADYFIHKDLRGFLTREKDRFIKNVVFSDLETLLNRQIDNTTLIIARAFNAVATRIIEFLDTLETFQRNIFTLKKKVIDTHWLISVGKIPERFHAAIFDNKDQVRQFAEMYGVTVESAGELRAHPTLVVDTGLFDEDWTLDLLSVPAFDNLDEQTDGLLVHSENWQALNVLQEKFRGQVKCIYIDPPYNTGGDEFLYKDSFRHSSWVSMLENRLELAAPLLDQAGSLTQAIGREELANLFLVADEVMGGENRVGELIWEKGRKNDARFFSLGHDYMIVYAKDYNYLKSTGALWREEKPGAREILTEWRRLKEIHGDNYGAIQGGIRDFYSNLPAGHISLKHRRYNRVDRNGLWRDDNMSWPGGGGPRYDVIHPDTKKPCKVPDGGWRFSAPEKFWLYFEQGFIEFREDHTEPPILKRYLNYVPTEFDPDARRGNGNGGDGEESNVQVMPSVFYKSQQPTVVALRHLMDGDVFKNPKDPEVIGRTLNYMGGNDALNLDFFGGSGTTAHAIIALNKQDGDKGKRKFILVEMGAYFETVLKPRIQKVMYSLNWRDGKPIADQVDGYQGIVKVQRLEQYEDLLANLETAWDGETLPKGVPVQYLFRPEHNKLVASLDLSRPFTQTVKAGKAREEKIIDLMETWLYLQGYWVKSRRRYLENGRKYLAVETTIGVLVVFRDIDTGEDDSAALNAIIDRYTGERGEPTVMRLEVNCDADIRRVKLPVTLVQAADFDRGASWN